MIDRPTPIEGVDLIGRLRERADWEDEEGASPYYSAILREAADALEKCRALCLEVGSDAHEAAKAKDATDYVAGYQDAAVDCDEAIREFFESTKKPI